MGIWRAVLVFGALSAFGPLSMDLYLPVLPELGRELGTSTTLTQLTMTVSTIGLGLGQFVIGPLSDRYGRRLPIIIGVTVFTLFSVACAFAPDIWSLILFRFIQGLGGAAGMVVGRAAIRDMYEGSDMARILSWLMLVSGLAPILAPIAGGQLALIMDWRGLFLVLAGIGGVLLLIAIFGVKETLAPNRRQTGGMAGTVRDMRTVTKDKLFIGIVLILGLTTASFATYLAMSSFVFQDELGVTPVAFSLIFAINSVALMMGAQTNGLLVKRFGLSRLVDVALLGVLISIVGVVLAASVGASIIILCAVLALSMYFQAWLNPNTTALALQNHSQNAGTASALLGTAQFLVGPLVAPLVSLGGVSSLIMSVTMLSSLVCAAVLWATRVRRHAYAAETSEDLQ